MFRVMLPVFPVMLYVFRVMLHVFHTIVNFSENPIVSRTVVNYSIVYTVVNYSNYTIIYYSNHTVTQ